MYQLVKFGDHRSYRNGDTNSYMDLFEKAELTFLVCHITRVLKLGMSIYISKVLDMAGRKTKKRRRTQAIAECFVFHAKAKVINLFLG